MMKNYRKGELFTPPVIHFLRIFKLKVEFAVSALILFALAVLASCSTAGNDGSVSVTIPSRSALVGSRNSSARAGAGGHEVTVFITGDYVASQTVPVQEEDQNVPLTVTFDSIPTGAKVRAVFAYIQPRDDEGNMAIGAVGASSEIEIQGGSEQNAAISAKRVKLIQSDSSAKIIYDNDSIDLLLSLAGDFDYRFSFSNSSSSFSHTTSSAYWDLGIGQQANAYAVEVEVFCSDTRVMRLYKRAME